MKVVLITPVTPYKENIGGPSAHPYHLMIERPENIDIIIYSFNNNNLSTETIHQVEQELHVDIKLMKKPEWLKWILKLHLTFIRLLLKYPINYYIRLNKKEVEKISAFHPDLIWGYCQEFSGILKQFKEYKRLHTVPDCYSLHFYRRLGRRFTLARMKEYYRVVTNFSKHYRMERDYDSSDNIVYHLVGEEDKNFLLEINPFLNAHFIRHPHYDVNPNPNLDGRVKEFHQPNIKLLITGRNDFYMQQEADLLVERLCANANLNGKLLRDCYSITFLGKGWERHVKKLQDAGWKVNHITFAPDFIEEICKHDIQITPITIGTGTKGKVLDALANGLLVIGTPYAMENIAVEHGVSCIEYKYPQEVIDILHDIPMNREKYEAMAQAGQVSVQKNHDRRLLSKELFSL